MSDPILYELQAVPKGTKLAPKPEAIPDWDTLSDDEKKLFSHQVEVFAAYRRDG